MPPKPLLPGQLTKFGSIQVLRDGRVRFSARTVPSLPQLDFRAEHWIVLEDGRAVYDPSNYDVSANWRGEPVFFLHLVSRRATSAGFAYNLTPDALRHAVVILREAGNGIERWITPGLAHLQAGLAEIKAKAPIQKALADAIPEVLDSVRDIPIAHRWKPLRREWEKWKRKQAAPKHEEGAAQDE